MAHAEPAPKTRQQRFRAKHPRIDYVPHGDPLVILDQVRARYPGFNTRQLLDMLIEHGARVLLPETVKMESKSVGLRW